MNLDILPSMLNVSCMCVNMCLNVIKYNMETQMAERQELI